jgi:3-oxoacyl-(acyl-carrier-protein) synthase
LVGAVLQIDQQKVYGNVNITALADEILNHLKPSQVPLKTIDKNIKKLLKASFGFGDVNACVVLGKYEL